MCRWRCEGRRVELSLYGATMRAGLCSGCLVRCMIDVWWLDPEPVERPRGALLLLAQYVCGVWWAMEFAVRTVCRAPVHQCDVEAVCVCVPVCACPG